VVLDGVYNHASLMLRTLSRRCSACPTQVALTPTTVSRYHRAQKSYGHASSGLGRICSVEAVALLMDELGEVPSLT
jgi:hypothetical protein